MTELDGMMDKPRDKQSKTSKTGNEKKPVTNSHKSAKTKLVKIAPAPDKK